MPRAFVLLFALAFLSPAARAQEETSDEPAAPATSRRVVVHHADAPEATEPTPSAPPPTESAPPPREEAQAPEAKPAPHRRKAPHKSAKRSVHSKKHKAKRKSAAR